MKVMRRGSNRRGFTYPSGVGGSFSNKPFFSDGGLLFAAESIYFLLIVMPEYLGFSMHIAIMIAVRTAITLTALPAMWRSDDNGCTNSTRILLTAEITLLWLELIPGCLRPAILLHLIVFFGMIADMLITTSFLTITKTELISYLTPGLRLCAISAIRLNADGGGDAYFVAALVLGILCGIASAVALILSRRINKILCVCCGLVVVLLSFYFFFSSVLLVNYSLDFSEPEHHSAVLEEFDHNSRAIDGIIVTIQGKRLELTAPAALYLRCDTCDTLSVLEYTGPLGITYYMIEYPQ